MFEVLITPTAQAVIEALVSGPKRDAVRLKKVGKALRLLGNAPNHPGLVSHRYDSLDDLFGEKVWESYVENSTPSAWRIWWYFGPDNMQITVVDLGPHP